MTSFQLISLVIGLPVIGFLILSLLGGRIVDSLGVAKGRKLCGTIAVLAVASSFGLGLSILLDLMKLPVGERAVVVNVFDWITLSTISIPFELRVDPLSMTMVMVITGIGSLIHLYATGYMAEEKDYPRFFCYLNLFVAFMLVLVLGNNLPILFIGWEGVGLCSYLLIGFWYKDLANSTAANKAFITNRIGDVGLVIGMFLLMVLMQPYAAEMGGRLLSYDTMIPKLPEALASNPTMATAIALCLFVGACGKSAQFPLYVWLPDAMAGPTPVSALIHAATMVTSGVVLLNRMQDVFLASPVASAVVVVVGLFTAIFAALIAFGQTDIKKVLAYSTVSQLGFMFIACGAGYYWVGMFHVITHAFFKALLFLGSGAVIHAMAHEQDMRNYGNLKKYIKITCWTMLIGHFAIAGLPWTSGWFSKEEILHVALFSDLATVNGVNFGNIAGWAGFGSALLTSIYMTRMMMLTFGGKTEQWRAIEAHHDAHHDDHHADHGHEHAHAHDHGPDTYGFFYTDEELAAMHEGEHDDHHHHLDASHEPHEVPKSMWIPLAILAVFSLGAGLWLKGYKYVPQLPKDTLEKWLASGAGHAAEHAEKGAHHGHIAGEHLIQPLGYSIGIIGMIIGYLWYMRGLPKAEGWDMRKWNPFRVAARNQFAYDSSVVEITSEGGTALGKALWWFDSKIVDGMVNGIGKVAGGLGLGVGKLQTGQVRSYALMTLIGAVGLIGWLVYTVINGGAN